jgi:hypothetical protein
MGVRADLNEILARLIIKFNKKKERIESIKPKNKVHTNDLSIQSEV